MKRRPKLDVLLLCAHPHFSMIWAPIHHSLDDNKRRGVSRIGESQNASGAMRQLNSGKINTLFLAPGEFDFGTSAKTSSELAVVARSFVERVRAEFPDVVFVLAFASENSRDGFLAASQGRFDRYLTVLAESAKVRMPSILDACRLWHERLAEQKARSPRSRVFLCHATGDKKAILDLGQRLRDDGFDPWIDKEQLLPGQDWEQEIRKAVRGSDAVIVCLSRHSVTKEGFIQKEIRYALDVADEKPDGTLFIIPLKLEACPLPERLQRWHFVTLFEDNGYKSLVAALRKITGRPPVFQPVGTSV